MQLVLLYGPPGVGKYTVGLELTARTGFRLLHNHLTVNLVSAVFERDSEIWLRMLRRLRRDMLTEAAATTSSRHARATSCFGGSSRKAAERWTNRPMRYV